MNSLFLAYCLLVLVGVVWVAYRALIYMRTERERETRWTDMLEDEDFKKYLKQIATDKQTSGGQAGTEPDRAGDRVVSTPVRRPGLPPQQKNPSSAPPAPPPDRKPQQPRPQPKSSDRRPS